MSRLILFLTACVLCSACIPAQIPPQLTFTPAAPLIITDHQVNFGTFQVNYPDGWRVITGPGDSAPLAIFVDPDEIGLIQVVVANQATPPEFDAIPVEKQKTAERHIQLKDDTSVTIWLVTDETHIQEFLSILEQIIDSVTN